MYKLSGWSNEIRHLGLIESIIYSSFMQKVLVVACIAGIIFLRFSGCPHTCHHSPEKRKKITPVLQTMLQAIAKWMIHSQHFFLFPENSTL